LLPERSDYSLFVKVGKIDFDRCDLVQPEV